MKIVIIGGGIIGCSSALFLQESGHQVTILDSAEAMPNCSHGNAGYVCPSHFTPLATPGIVQQGLRWMLNRESPFYIQPRLNRDLIRWGWHFIRSANEKKVMEAAISLRDIALFSQSLYEHWAASPEFNFGYEKKGLLEIFQTKTVAEHAAHTCEKALELGLSGTRLLAYHELQEFEPDLKFNALGAIWFPGDAHLSPQLLMTHLKKRLSQSGVEFIQEKAIGFSVSGKQLKSVITAKQSISADAVVLAAGSWSGELTRQLNLSIPLVAGRGYSFTLSNDIFKLRHPAILTEGRVALTPLLGGKLRIGGTMEIVPTNAPPHFNRMKGVLKAVREFVQDKNIPFPEEKDIWYGYRPCSGDGLPYIGRPKQWNNLVVATGHAMIGLSLGAGTGKLVADLVDDQPPAINLEPFHPDRFN
jgi:D-amino-acid dehydrogenase